MEKDINLAIAERLKVKTGGYGICCCDGAGGRHIPFKGRTGGGSTQGPGRRLCQHSSKYMGGRGGKGNRDLVFRERTGASDSGRLAALVHKEAVRSTGAEARELREGCRIYSHRTDLCSIMSDRDGVSVQSP